MRARSHTRTPTLPFRDSKQRPMKLAVDGLKKTWDATKTRVWLEAAKNKGMYTSLWHLGDIGYADDAYAHDPLHFSYETAYNVRCV